MSAVLTYAEAAEALGISCNAVECRVRRGTLTRAGSRSAVAVDALLLGQAQAERVEGLLARRRQQAEHGPLAAMLASLPVYPGVQQWYQDRGWSAQIAESCSYVLRIFAEAAGGMQACRRWGWESTGQMYADVLRHLAEARPGGAPLHKARMRSEAVLRRRLAPFRGLPETASPETDARWQAAMESLVSRKLGNRNRARPEFHQAIIRKIWADADRQEGMGALPDATETWRRYKLALEAMRAELEASGLPVHEADFRPYTRQNVHNIISGARTRLLHGGARHGKAWSLRHAAPHHHRGRPGPWAVLTGDGVTLGTLVAPGAGSGRSRSESLTVWIWRDWHSGATVGWAFGRGGESPAMVAESLGEVYRRWGRLPGTVQIDDKMRHKSGIGEMFGRLGIRVMGKEAYRPQSLYAETGNRAFNGAHRKLDPDWVNRTAHGDNFRRAWEDLRPGKEIKSEAEARALAEDIIAVQNGTASEALGGRSPMEVLALAQAESPAREPEMRHLAWYFGKRRKAAVRRGVIQITPELDGRRIRYMLDDYARHLPHNAARLEVIVCWYGSFETVHAYSLDGRFLDTCRQVELYNPDPLTRTEDDRRIIAEQSAQVEKFRQRERGAAADADRVLELHDIDYARLMDHTRAARFGTERARGMQPAPAHAEAALAAPGHAEAAPAAVKIDFFARERLLLAERDRRRREEAAAQQAAEAQKQEQEQEQEQEQQHQTATA